MICINSDLWFMNWFRVIETIQHKWNHNFILFDIVEFKYSRQEFYNAAILSLDLVNRKMEDRESWISFISSCVVEWC